MTVFETDASARFPLALVTPNQCGITPRIYVLPKHNQKTNCKKGHP